LNRRREEGNRDTRRVSTDSREFRKSGPGGQSMFLTIYCV
jgi:hypothetical protein